VISLAGYGSGPVNINVGSACPPRVRKQRAYASTPRKFGHAWVKEHHFDNKGKLPTRAKKGKAVKKSKAKGSKGSKGKGSSPKGPKRKGKKMPSYGRGKKC
jgi:hypothetical protein